MLFRALAADGSELRRREYYSIGGGFVLDQDEAGRPAIVEDATPVKYPFRTGDELLAHTRETGLRISDVMLANELSWRTETEIRERPAAHLVGHAGMRRRRASRPRACCPAG